MQKPTKRQTAIMDAQIERAYYRLAQGVQISVLDIGKVFAAGRAALATGADLDAAITAVVAILRK